MNTPLTKEIDRTRPVAQRRSSLIRSSTDIADRVNSERASRIEIESSPKINHTKHIKLVVRGVNGTKVEEGSSANDIINQVASTDHASKEQELTLTALIEEYQASLNRSDCENSNCHRFKILSYKISQTLLERINDIKSELKVAKSNCKIKNDSNNNRNSKDAPKASISELDDINTYGLDDNLSVYGRKKETEVKQENEKLINMISERTKRIQELEKHVEEQRKLRLQDATQVEEKAARIKEWVANKLQELEIQNRQLRDQNRKSEETIESLKLQIARSISHSSSRTLDHASGLQLNDKSSASGGCKMMKESVATKVSFPLESGRGSPIYDSVSMDHTNRLRQEEEKPPPPPLHQNDKWEMELYQLAEDTFTNLVRNSNSDNPEGCHSRGDTGSVTNMIASLIRPSFTTIHGDQVVEGYLDKNINCTDELMHNELCDDISRRISGDHQSQASSLSDRQRKSSIDCPSEVDVTPAPIRRLFDSPLRSRSGHDCILRTQSVRKSPAPEKLHDFLVADLIKRGYLVKPGALKSHNRWFVLKNFHLYSFKSESEEVAKSTPLTKIKLGLNCQIFISQQSGESSYPFKLVFPEKTIQLVAPSDTVREEWARMLTVTVNLSDIEPDQLNRQNVTYEGLLSMTRHGTTKRYFAILINHVIFFLKSFTDPSPMSYLSVKNSRIREITDSSDYDPEDGNMMKHRGISQDCSLAIYPRFATSLDPVYITLGSRNETDKWFHFLSIASGLDQSYGTPFERTLSKIMINNSLGFSSTQESSENRIRLWRQNPVMTYTDKPIASPLTSLPNETLRSEAIEMFRSILLFTQVPLQPIAVDYHVSLLQNCLDRFLKNSELRNEFYAQLIKQSTYIEHEPVDESEITSCNGINNNEITYNGKRCNNNLEFNSLTKSETPKSSSKFNNASQADPIHYTAISSEGINTVDRLDSVQDHPPVPTQTAMLQVMQILAIAVSLNLPRGRMRWWLTDHLRKFAIPETEIGKYALYNLKAIERATANGSRENVPSRTEIMSILLRNPYNHSTPHSIPVNFSDSSYIVVEADGSTTVEEFMDSIAKVLDVRNSADSDFFLFADDPSDTSELHILEPQRKVLDVVGWWEQSFRRNNSGRFENTKVIKLLCKKRLLFRAEDGETYQERLLILHQMNQEIVSQRVPLSNQLAIQLASFMVQLSYGDFEKSKDTRLLERILDRAHYNYLPKNFPQQSENQWKDTVAKLTDCWQRLAGRSPQDCIRVYLNCLRRFKFGDE